MKRFGIGKKDKMGDDAADEASRNRLFGSRSSKPKISSPMPVSASANPYAAQSQQPSSNPYAVPQHSTGRPDPYTQQPRLDPYTQLPKAASAAPSGYAASDAGRNGYGTPARGPQMQRATSNASQPPAYDSGYGGMGNNYRNEKSAAPTGAGNVGYYNSSGLAAQRGYGADRWGDESSTTSTRSPGGGYGGMGRTYSQETLDTDAGREALFGGAKERVQQREAQTSLPPDDNQNQGYGGWSGALGDTNPGYGGFQDRQLTAEEQEEEDVGGVKSQIKELKREDVSSTRNALRLAAQAEETGRATLERLGAQGERIYAAEKNLNRSANQNRMAEDKARELKRLNRSMFAPNVGNPFTKTRRAHEADEEIVEQHIRERDRREATQAAEYASMTRYQTTQRDLRDKSGAPIKKTGLAERSKYQFEADSDDEAMEDEIDTNLDALSGAAGTLNLLGKAIGKELETQNKHIEELGSLVDKVDIGLVRNRRRLDQIK